MYNGVTDTRSKADFRMYRDMLHVSQQVMGHMLGYSRAAVADWEDPAAWVPGRDAWERLLRRWRRAEKKAMALVDLSAGVDRPVLPYRIRVRDGVGDTMIWHFENLASRLAWDELRRSGVEAGVTRPGADPGDPSLADASMLGLRMDLLCLPQSTLADLAGVTRGRLQSWRSGTGPRPDRAVWDVLDRLQERVDAQADRIVCVAEESAQVARRAGLRPALMLVPYRRLGGDVDTLVVNAAARQAAVRLHAAGLGCAMVWADDPKDEAYDPE